MLGTAFQGGSGDYRRGPASEADHRGRAAPKVVSAAVIEAATSAATRATIDTRELEVVHFVAGNLGGREERGHGRVKAESARRGGLSVQLDNGGPSVRN